MTSLIDKEIHEASGIPKASFIESVEDHLNREGVEPDEMLSRLQKLILNYKNARSKLQAQRANLERKLPRIEETLETLDMLEQKSGEPVRTQFAVADNIYASARVEDAERVYLWIGANVLLEYPRNEARELLENNLKSAVAQLAQVSDALSFCHDQVTVSEVNMARVYNYRVIQRKRERDAALEQKQESKINESQI
jgi:prefoldin subunit 5